MESVGDSYSTLGTLNTGKNRVKGIEFGMVGNITDKLSIQFSAAKMDSEILESYNPANIGLVLSNFADESAYLQLRYEPTESFVFGGSYTYQSEMYGGQPDTAAGYDSDNSRYSIVVPRRLWSITKLVSKSLPGRPLAEAVAGGTSLSSRRLGPMVK